jgi:insulysin
MPVFLLNARQRVYIFAFAVQKRGGTLRHLIALFLVFIFTACSFSKQQKFEIRKINGMEFSSMKLANRLDVLLVHDPRFKSSSAAMAVAVGSLEDPEMAQGMAHYLEHMLFLGTKEFPKSDEYSTYMETHGGWDNAYTSDEVTNYMFEVDNGALEGALHRFSRFFVSPTFDATYISREKNAVNSEFEKNIKQDGWRQDRYVNILAKKNHPYKKFSTGNSQTLAAVNREDVIQFYRKYYSANNMKLVVMSSQPLGLLRDWVGKYFSDVPNFNSQRPQYEDFFFDEKDKNRLHFVKSIQDIEEMSILFNVPDETKYWKSKPLSILSKLLGDEGPGSLLSYLKKEGLALELSASETFWRTFGINITLTPKGRKEYVKVIQAVEKYLQLIRKNKYPEYLFKDEKALRQIALDNLEPSSSGQKAAHFAKSLMDYPAHEFLERNYLIHEYSTQDFSHFLNYLDLEKAHILLLSQNESTNGKEDIFGVEFRRESNEVFLREKPKKESEEIFVYPPANKYVPTDFSLVTKSPQRLAPQRIEESNGNIFYIQTDTELGIAKASVKLHLRSALEATAQTGALMALYMESKNEEMREWLYPISEAGAHFQIASGSAPNELVISISGYSQRLMQIFRDGIFEAAGARRIDEVKIDEKLFQDLKTRMKRDLQNIDEMVAFQRLSSEASTVANSKAVHWKDVLKNIDSVKLTDVQQFAKNLFSKVSIKTVAYGNIEKDVVSKMVSEFYDLLKMQSPSLDLAKEKNPLYRVIPLGEEYNAPIMGKNNNHAMQTYYNLAPWSVQNHAMILVLSQLISQPYFSELRTNQQLGYVARAGGTHNSGYVGITAGLQSPKVNSVTLQEKSHDFIKGFFEKKIKTLTDEELSPIITSLQNELLMPATTLAEREGEFYQASMRYDGRFQIREELAQALKSVDAKNMKSFIEDKFLKGSVGRLSFFYYGQNTKIDKKKFKGKVFDRPVEVKWDVLNPYQQDPKN